MTVAVLTLIPILNIITIVASTGANNLSNDYIAYVNLVGAVLDGTYRWSHFFRDTFVRAHCMVLPVLVRLVIVRLSEWNVYGELYVVIALAVVRLALLHAALFSRAEPAVGWSMWPILSALVFSVSQINVYTFGDAGLQVGLSQLGFVFALWGLQRFSGRWPGVWAMDVGGLVASYSGGAGLAAWPVLLGGLVVLGYRQKGHYAVWLGASVLAVWPYLEYMFIHPLYTTGTGVISFFNYQLWIRAVGQPFTNGIVDPVTTTLGRVPLVIGLLGIGFVAVGMGILAAIRSGPALRQATPALMLIVFGALNIWQTSLYRALLAPWYTTTFMNVWLGAVGLVYAVWLFSRTTRLRTPVTVWAVCFLIALAVIYFRSNLRYEDKVMYLNSRTPASASCLRNYRTAPTYCEEYLFQWGSGYPGNLPLLAGALEQHGLSVFSSHQEWALQGDFVLDTVGVEDQLEAPGAFWTEGLTTEKRTSFRHYKHLNLFLHTPNSVTWTVSLPPNTRHAALHSAVAISPSAPYYPAADGTTFEIYIERTGKKPTKAFSKRLSAHMRDWHPFVVPLRKYAGQTMTIRFTSDGGTNLTCDWAMYRYPYLDIVVDPPGPSGVVQPPWPVAAPTADDVRFDVRDMPLWRVNDMTPAGEGTAAKWTVGKDPYLVYNQPLDLCLADYSHLFVRMAASPEISPRLMSVLYQVEGAGWQGLNIPLRADGDMHEYTFDLKLLELNKGVRLTYFRLDPVPEAAAAGANRVEIDDIRLIRKDRLASVCR